MKATDARAVEKVMTETQKAKGLQVWMFTSGVWMAEVRSAHYVREAGEGPTPLAALVDLAAKLKGEPADA